jgi:hypothetical protein
MHHLRNPSFFRFNSFRLEKKYVYYAQKRKKGESELVKAAYYRIDVIFSLLGNV